MSIEQGRFIGVVALAVAACGGNPEPVPVIGSGAAVASLVGEWTGEYRSLEAGRSGSIYFRLEPGTAVASGDVLMVPEDRRGHDHPPGEHPPSEYIPIRFVRVEGDQIRGTLDIYLDPVCRCRLETTFEGSMRGDTISGAYSSRHLDAGRVQRGEWYAIRTRQSP
jgi:hypothetical protein